MSLSNYEQAIPYLIEGLKLDRNNIEGHTILGFCHLHTGGYTQALASFNRAIDLDPEYPYAHYGKAFALERIGGVCHDVETELLDRRDNTILLLCSPYWKENV